MAHILIAQAADQPKHSHLGASYAKIPQDMHDVDCLIHLYILVFSGIMAPQDLDVCRNQPDSYTAPESLNPAVKQLCAESGQA
jgi:hypothetical protein